jgi:drug/metabolite transporter (DMT)-like permease
MEQRLANLAGIAWMVTAVGALSFMDAAMKELSAHYPPVQVAALRGLVALPLVVAWVAFAGGLGQLVRVRWGLHLARGLLGVAMLTAFVFAVRALPLAEAYAIFFVSPLLITALSVPLLGERVGPHRWGAIAVGLVGVLVVLRPTGGGALSLAGLAALGAAGCYALSAIWVRILGRTDSTLAMVFWLTAMVAAGAGALAAPRWVAVSWSHWPLLATVAVTGAFGQFALTQAFRVGEASVIAPFEYSALAWGLGLDWALWSALPSTRTLAGSAIVIAAGLYIIHRERRPGVVPAPTPNAGPTLPPPG